MRATVVAVGRICLNLVTHLNDFYPLPRTPTVWHAPLAQKEGIRSGTCQTVDGLLLSVIHSSVAVQNSDREH